MSGFQFQDLGTGRQYTMTQSRGSGGSFLSGPMRGGQTLEGTPSQFRANTVDPLATILGSVAQGAQGFIKSKDQMKNAFERSAQKKIDKINNQYLENLSNENMTKEEANLEREKQTRELYKSGKINKNLDAVKNLNTALAEASDATFKDQAKAKLSAVLEKRANAAMDLQAREAEVIALEIEVQGGPLESILRAQIDELKQKDKTERTRKSLLKDVSNTNLSFVNAKTNDFGGPSDILNLLNELEVDIDSPEAFDSLSEEYLTRYYLPFIEEANPENQAWLTDMASAAIAEEVEKDIGLVRERIRADKKSEEHRDSILSLNSVLSGDAFAPAGEIASSIGGTNDPSISTDLREAGRIQAVQTEVSRALGQAWFSSSQQGNRGQFQFNILKEQALDLALDSGNPLAAMARLREALPVDAETAMNMGYMPRVTQRELEEMSPEERRDFIFEKQEAWDGQRELWETELREAQLVKAKGAFAEQVDAFEGNPLLIASLFDELSDMAGYDGPLGLSEDGTVLQVPLTYSGEGTAFMGIWNTINDKYMQAQKGLTTSGSDDERYIQLATAGFTPQESLRMSGRETRPSITRIEQSSSFNTPLEILMNSDRGLPAALEHYSAKAEAGLLTPMDTNILTVLDSINAEGRTTPEAEALLHGLTLQAWKQTAGKNFKGGDAHIIVAEQSQSKIAGLFGGDEVTGKYPNGTLAYEENDAVFVATLWETLGDNDSRRAMFGDHYETARLTVATVEDAGGVWDTSEKKFQGVDGTQFSRPASVERQGEASRLLQGTLENVGGTAEYVERGMDMIFNPSSIKIGETIAPFDAYALKSVLDDGFTTSREQIAASIGMVDFDAETDSMAFIFNVPGVREDIQDRVHVRMLNLVANSPELVQSPESFGNAFSNALKAEVNQYFHGKTLFNGRLLDDKSGGIRSLTEATGSNSAKGAWTRFSGISASDFVEARGIELEPDTRAEVITDQFYQMFDLPAISETQEQLEPEQMMERAKHIAVKQGLDEPTLEHMLAAHTSIQYEVNDIDAPQYRTAFENAMVDVDEGGQLVFTFPNFGSSYGVEYTDVVFNYPRHLQGRATKLPPTLRERMRKEQEAAEKRARAARDSSSPEPTMGRGIAGAQGGFGYIPGRTGPGS